MKHFALAGNPNCGKTTLFNNLTGSTAHVGNWPGVTVEKREGIYKKLKEPVSIVDLPGIYSLSPYSPEEIISRNYLLQDKVDCIINILDVTKYAFAYFIASSYVRVITGFLEYLVGAFLQVFFPTSTSTLSKSFVA